MSKTGLFRRFFKKKFILPVLIGGLFLSGAFFIWIATLKLPDVSTFEARLVSQSTKFYDRTGEIPLFNVYEEVRRTEVPLEDISPYLRSAAVAIEDDKFYEHHGVRPIAFLRAVIANAMSLSFSQGGSTITQQVVKNSLLTADKSPIRKIKEWFLAIKLEKVLTKEEILSVYLNENPYGGNLYGAEEASKAFFGKSAKDLTLAEAAYLAALPQAPTYYSPYGNHKEALDARKNLVLEKMKDLDLIGEEEYKTAKVEQVTFKPSGQSTIIAPHFVFYLRDYLQEKYGIKTLEEGGLKIITTIDADLQKKAEEIVKRYALSNEKTFNAENAGLVAIDPKTGQILAMVGSRDFNDKEIDGNFNVATAKRQPGSSFKPFVYATALKEGYTDKTVVFDVKTEFSTQCSVDGKPLSDSAVCYDPENYDLKFRGPVTMREALAQSMNVPAVKFLYLAGIKDSIQTAKDMGITTLTDPDRYGLTMVLGGGEVELLELTSAYGVFANDGVRSPATGILKITGGEGETLEEYQDNSRNSLDPEVARTITSILSDDVARTPLFGAHSKLYFEGRDVAAKTGTTNDYHDAWVVGYTPSLVAGAWAGNNDNRAMEKKVAGQIVAPLWHEFMEYALSRIPNETFPLPNTDLDPGLPAPLLGKVGVANGEPHDILYFVNKNNPRSGPPSNPDSDSQFSNWEYGVREWLIKNGGLTSSGSALIETSSPTQNNTPVSLVNGFPSGTVPFSRAVTFSVNGSSGESVLVYLNGTPIGSLSNPPFYFSLNLREYASITKEQNTIKVIKNGPNGQQSVELPLFINLQQ